MNYMKMATDSSNLPDYTQSVQQPLFPPPGYQQPSYQQPSYQQPQQYAYQQQNGYQQNGYQQNGYQQYSQQYSQQHVSDKHKDKKPKTQPAKLPWWAILLITLAVAGVIAVVIFGIIAGLAKSLINMPGKIFSGIGDIFNKD